MSKCKQTKYGLTLLKKDLNQNSVQILSFQVVVLSRVSLVAQNLDGINLTCWPSIPNLVSNYHDPNFHLIWFAGAPARNNNRRRFECWPVPSSITNEYPAPYFNKNDTIRSLPRSTNESVLGSFSTQP